jgi:hypothetical protein
MFHNPVHPPSLLAGQDARSASPHVGGHKTGFDDIVQLDAHL